MYQLTAMVRRLTRALFGHTSQVNVLGKQNKSQKTLLCEARDVSNAQANLSLPHSRAISVTSLGTCTVQFDPEHTAGVTKFTL